MYVGLKQPRGDGERYVTPARAAAKETTILRTTRINALSRIALKAQDSVIHKPMKKR